MTMYNDETKITNISFPIFQVHTIDHMLFCVDTSAFHFCIGDKPLERITRHYGRISISIIDSKRDYKFVDRFIGCGGMVQPMLPSPGSTFDIPVILDVIEVYIQKLVGQDDLDRNTVLGDILTSHLCSPIITNKKSLRFEDMWKIKLLRKEDHLCVPLSTSIQLLYTMIQLQKLHNNLLIHQKL